MNFENRSKVSIDEYMEMIRLKTAVLIGASFYLGGLLANAPEKDLQELYNFGIQTGLVFQLQDDLLDTYGNEKTFGKIQFGDITANKKTFLFLKALELADEKTRAKLVGLYSTPGIPKDEKIHETLGIFAAVDVKSQTQQKIREHHELALKCFSRLNVEPARRRNLLSYSDALIGRIS